MNEASVEPARSAEDHFERGNALAAAGQAEAAAAAYRQALALRSQFPHAWTHLGNVLHSTGRSAEAVEAFRAALSQGLDHPLVHYNLGTALRRLGDPIAAVAAFERARALAPESAAVLNNLGNAWRDLGRWAEAAASYAEAVRLRPDHAEAHANLGAVLCLWHEADPGAAAGTARAWRLAHPEQPIASHLAAALTGDGAPERASDAYVRQTFDDFAGEFDQQLAALGYRAPALIAAAVAEPPAVAGTLEVLDAGCGTGLCGAWLRPSARRLTGVDLSPAMLERAAARQLYDVLEAAELTGYLALHRDRFDLIVAADVFCYFGPLGPVLAGAAAALCPGGRLAFTVERGVVGGPAAELGPQGRYRHTEAGVRDALGAAGLTVLGLTEAVLRHHAGRPVAGLVVVAAAKS